MTAQPLFTNSENIKQAKLLRTKAAHSRKQVGGTSRGSTIKYPH
jgi:hypothetical protein